MHGYLYYPFIVRVPEFGNSIAQAAPRARTATPRRVPPRGTPQPAGSPIRIPTRHSGAVSPCNYPDFEPFDLPEIDAFCGLYIVNGLHPAPRIEMHLQSPVQPITENTLKTKFPRRFDGTAHGFKVCTEVYCQWCMHKAKQELEGPKVGEKRKVPAKNKCNVVRCSVCCVRLCEACWHEWHAIA